MTMPSTKLVEGIAVEDQTVTTAALAAIVSVAVVPVAETLDGQHQAETAQHAGAGDQRRQAAVGAAACRERRQPACCRPKRRAAAATGEPASGPGAAMPANRPWRRCCQGWPAENGERGHRGLHLKNQHLRWASSTVRAMAIRLGRGDAVLQLVGRVAHWAGRGRRRWRWRRFLMAPSSSGAG